MSTTNTYRTILSRLNARLATTEPSTEITLTTGGTTTFAATGATLGKSGTLGYTGMHAVCVFDAGGAGAAPELQDRIIVSNSSTTWTVTPAFTTTASSDIMLILQGGLTEPMVREATNDIIRNLPLPRYVAASLLPDGDMELTYSTNNWTDVASATTGTKTTTAGQVFTGTSAFRLQPTASGDGVRSTAGLIPCETGEQFYVSVVLRMETPSQTCSVSLYDHTNSAVIGTARSVTGAGWIEVRFQDSAPSTCESIGVEILSTSAGTGDIYIDYVQILSDQRMSLTPPASIVDTALIEGVFSPRWTDNGQDADTYIPQGFDLDQVRSGDSWRDYAASVSHRVEVGRTWGYPLFWSFRATDTVVSAMTSTVVAPLEPLVEAILSRCRLRMFEASADPDTSGKMAALSVAAARTAYALERSLGIGEPINPVEPQRRVGAPTR